MFEQEIGVIIKRFDHTSKYAVITKNMGKIILIVAQRTTKSPLSTGSIVSFGFKHINQSTYVTHIIEVLTVLQPQTFADVAWFHHMAEMSYYFVPLGQSSTELCSFLCACINFVACSHIFGADWLMTQKLLTGTFFMVLGFFPDQADKSFIVPLNLVLFLFVDISNVEKVECVRQYGKNCTAEQLAKLNDWCLGCIKTHPRVLMFKTITGMYQKKESLSEV